MICITLSHNWGQRKGCCTWVQRSLTFEWFFRR